MESKIMETAYSLFERGSCKVSVIVVWYECQFKYSIHVVSVLYSVRCIYNTYAGGIKIYGFDNANVRV